MARSIGVNGNKKWGAMDWYRPLPYAKEFFCTSSYARDKHFAISKGMEKKKARGAKKKVIACCPAGDVCHDDVSSACIIEDTRHRDGSIYKRNHGLLALYRIADRHETRLEPMMLSEPTNCLPHRETCSVHHPSRMMQIYSLKLAKVLLDVSSVQLYGYIAVRDWRDSLLNYIVSCSRDDPIIIRQGSLIEMIGPKRGISMDCSVLFEFDMRIKKGEREEDDLQLIDGAVDYSEVTIPCEPFTNRINGDGGAVDITLSLVYKAVEATIEVAISDVQSDFNLSLSSFVYINESCQEIQLFHGVIGEPCVLRRFVVAAVMDTRMRLMFKIGRNGSKNGIERFCRFKVNKHGCDARRIRVEPASISVKVTWSVLPD